MAGASAANVAAYDEAMTTLQRARTMLKSEEHLSERLLVDLEIADIYGRRGLIAESKDLLEPLVEVARKAGARLALSQILGQLGRLALWKDELDAAHAYLEEALPLTEEVGDEVAQMFLLRQMGNMYLNEPEKADPYFDRSAALARKLGRQADEASAINGKAIIAHNREDLEGAIKLYGEAMEIAKRIGDKTTHSMVVGNLAEVYREQGDIATARRCAEEAYRLATETGDKGHRFTGMYLLGALYLDEEKNEEALDRLKGALKIAREMDYYSPDLVIAFAWYLSRTGDRKIALEWVGNVRAMKSWQATQQEKDIRKHMPELRRDLSDAEVAEAMKRGEGRTLKDIYAQMEAVTAGS
jgi:tetratricopeptide (TPR) repeat protein